MKFHQPAKPAPAYWHLAKTLPVLALYWLVSLGVLPAAIVRLQHAAKLEHLFFEPQYFVAVIVFVVGATLSIWSVVALAFAGGGTPLPFDVPRRLVVSGPYARMRNPMAAGFVVQGAGVALWAGSVLVLLYVLLVAFWWNAWRRPADEDRLQRAFGRDFEAYRRHVPCWLPLRRRWSPPPMTGPISLEELPDRDRRRSRA